MTDTQILTDSSMESPVEALVRSGAPRLAYARYTPSGENIAAGTPETAALPTVMFLSGFRSDMQGTKAWFLESRCRARKQPYIRFDYSGHGQSAGRFQDCTLEMWRDDALAVLDRLSDGPVIIVGSSMGGWLGLVLALQRPDRIKGLIGIAAAPDFTRDMVTRFDDVMRESYAARGYAEIPNDYSPEPYIITQELIESGNRMLILNQAHELPIPVRLLQGLQDREVAGTMPQAIADCLNCPDLKIHLVEDGDHSLSRPEDLALIDRQIDELNGLLT